MVLDVAEQPRESVAVKVYDPGRRLDVVTGVNVYVGVPPDPLKDTLPRPPEQTI